MTPSTKNPWTTAGLVAGVSVAAGIWLVWPSPAAVGQRTRQAIAQKPATEMRSACRLCQEQRCELTLAACYGRTDGKPITWPPADAGGPPSPEAQAGCQEVYECFRRTGCAALDPGVCYCGQGVEAEKCFSGQATPRGPCKELVEKQARTKDPAAIGLRYSDSAYPLGLAEDLYLCDTTFCHDACK